MKGFFLLHSNFILSNFFVEIKSVVVLLSNMISHKFLSIVGDNNSSYQSF